MMPSFLPFVVAHSAAMICDCLSVSTPAIREAGVQMRVIFILEQNCGFQFIIRRSSGYLVFFLYVNPGTVSSERHDRVRSTFLLMRVPRASANAGLWSRSVLWTIIGLTS